MNAVEGQLELAPLKDVVELKLFCKFTLFCDWFIFYKRSPVGVTESTPQLFGNAWKTSSACILVHDSSQMDPCDLHLQSGGQWWSIIIDKCICTYYVCAVFLIGWGKWNKAGSSHWQNVVRFIKLSPLANHIKHCLSMFWDFYKHMKYSLFLVVTLLVFDYYWPNVKCIPK